MSPKAKATLLIIGAYAAAVVALIVALLFKWFVPSPIGSVVLLALTFVLGAYLTVSLWMESVHNFGDDER